MSFFQIVFGNTTSTSINMLFTFWISAYILERNINKKQGNFIKNIISTILFIIGVSIFGAIFYKAGIFRWPYNIGNILFTYPMLLIETFLLQMLYEEDQISCWLSAIFFEMIDSFAMNVGFLFSPYIRFNLNILNERILYCFFLFGIIPSFKIILVLILKKTKMGKIFRQWLEQKNFRSSMVLFLSLYPILMEALDLLIKFTDKMNDEQNGMLCIIYLLIVGIVFHYIIQEEQQRMRLEEQQISLKQQRTYIKNLEELQIEMRRFRHDYKNMMSGMYLQAKEGDMEALQSFIQEMTEDFDSQVGGQIRRLTQLSNIHILEVKGLLLRKLEEMQKEEIDCELEVLCPFYKTRLRNTDLCRCLGILIDNAMEEVRGKEKPKIHIMISSQKGYTTFRIQNLLYSTIDFHKIWIQGYSTKGNNRGIGLASYKKILERYDNIIPLTTIRDGYFIQELKVQEEI